MLPMQTLYESASFHFDVMIYLQASKKEDTSQLDFPLRLYVQTPDQWHWQEQDYKVYSNIDTPYNDAAKGKVHAITMNAEIPSRVEWAALKNNDQYFDEAVAECYGTDNIKSNTKLLVKAK